MGISLGGATGRAQESTPYCLRYPQRMISSTQVDLRGLMAGGRTLKPYSFGQRFRQIRSQVYLLARSPHGCASREVFAPRE